MSRRFVRYSAERIDQKRIQTASIGLQDFIGLLFMIAGPCTWGIDIFGASGFPRPLVPLGSQNWKQPRGSAWQQWLCLGFCVPLDGNVQSQTADCVLDYSLVHQLDRRVKCIFISGVFWPGTGVYAQLESSQNDQIFQFSKCPDTSGIFMSIIVLNVELLHFAGQGLKWASTFFPARVLTTVHGWRHE